MTITALGTAFVFALVGQAAGETESPPKNDSAPSKPAESSALPLEAKPAEPTPPATESSPPPEAKPAEPTPPATAPAPPPEAKPAEPAPPATESSPPPESKPAEPAPPATAPAPPVTVSPETKPSAQPGEPEPNWRGRSLFSRNGQNLTRSGLWGWGLGLEFPSVGVVAGTADRSRPGWGYILGGALSWEATPIYLVRLYLAGGQTYGGRAGVRYVENVRTGGFTRSGQSAEWLGMETSVGVARLWRSAARQWTPYLGFDLGYRFAGYDFQFDDTLAKVEAIDLGDAFAQCTDADCRNDQHDALAWGFTSTLRVGVRLELANWLATRAGLAFTYVRTQDEEITNTVRNRQVHTAGEGVLFVRAVFTARFGL